MRDRVAELTARSGIGSTVSVSPPFFFATRSPCAISVTASGTGWPLIVICSTYWPYFETLPAFVCGAPAMPCDANGMTLFAIFVPSLSREIATVERGALSHPKTASLRCDPSVCRIFNAATMPGRLTGS
jgi:hypothetical protein